MKANAHLGSAIVSMMHDDDDVRYFRLFGGENPMSLDLDLAAEIRANAEKNLRPMRFCDGDPVSSLEVGRDGVLTHEWLLLPAGVYRMTMDMLCERENALLQWTIRDPAAIITRMTPTGTQRLQKGLNRISAGFEKPFAPYAVKVWLSVDKPGCHLLKWEIRPDALKLCDDIERMSKDGTRASWMRRASGADLSDIPVTACDALFNERIRIGRVGFPTTVKAGEPFSYFVEAQIEEFRKWRLEALSVFVHLEKDGKLAAAFDFPATRLTFDESVPSLHRAVVPEDLPPGSYELVVGIYMPRTRLRWHVTNAPERGTDRIDVQPVRVTAQPDAF